MFKRTYELLSHFFLRVHSNPIIITKPKIKDLNLVSFHYVIKFSDKIELQEKILLWLPIFINLVEISFPP